MTLDFGTFLRNQIFSYGNKLCKPKNSATKVVVEDVSVCEGDDAMTYYRNDAADSASNQLLTLIAKRIHGLRVSFMVQLI